MAYPRYFDYPAGITGSEISAAGVDEADSLRSGASTEFENGVMMGVGAGLQYCVPQFMLYNGVYDDVISVQIDTVGLAPKASYIREATGWVNVPLNVGVAQAGEGVGQQSAAADIIV